MAAALAGSSSASAIIPLPHHDEMYRLHVVRSTMVAASGQNAVREICGGANTNHGRTTPSTSARTSTTLAFTTHCLARGTGSIACDWSMPKCRSCALARDPTSSGSSAKYSMPTPRIGNSLAKSTLSRPATVRPVHMSAYTATMAKVICCRRSSFFASIQSGGRVGLASVTVHHRGSRSSAVDDDAAQQREEVRHPWNGRREHHARHLTPQPHRQTRRDTQAADQWKVQRGVSRKVAERARKRLEQHDPR